MGKPRGTYLTLEADHYPRRMTITTVRYRKNWRIRYAGLWRDDWVQRGFALGPGGRAGK